MNALIEAVESWVKALPHGVATVSYPAIPADDDYGLERIIAIRPELADACPLEVGVTRADSGSPPAAYVFLDTWDGIARRVGLRAPDNANDWVGLFLEPFALAAARLCEMCSAVARGAVHLEAGVRSDKLLWTAGSLQLSDGPFVLRAPRDPPPLAALWRALGLIRSIKVDYAPWF